MPILVLVSRFERCLSNIQLSAALLVSVFSLAAFVSKLFPRSIVFHK